MSANPENQSSGVETPPKQPVVNVVQLEREWPFRLIGNLLMLGTVLLVVAVILTLKNDLVNKRIQGLTEDFYLWAGERGLTLEDIIVSGRQRTTKTEVELAVGVTRGDNMLKMDVYAIKQSLEQLPWVKNADVGRGFFPNVLNVTLEEKQVAAIWQLNEKFYPLDEEGKVIKADFRTREPILLIVGAQAPEHLTELLTVINDTNPEYLKRIKVANFIAGRRWNLILDDIVSGITIKLPDEGIAEAWKKMLNLDKTKGLLKRKLTIIDLRLPDKVIVKLRKTKGEPPVELRRGTERNI